MKVRCAIAAGTAVLAWEVVLSGPAYAQVAGAPEAAAEAGEIIVTARKRAETLIEAPVVVTAVSGPELERRSINTIDSLARVVPQLITGESGGSAQGGSISIRGLGGNDGNPLADQGVSFNIDGIAVNRAGVRRLAYMDIGQIEVLKGPQALFFGKNSPGGIISIRSADPTKYFSGKVSGGYEFEGRERRGEGYVSGPLGDTLGFRIAAYGSQYEGWLDNITPESAPFGERSDHLPKSKEFAIRGTLKYEPSSQFDMRAKLSYGRLRNNGVNAIGQRIHCPLGAAQLGSIDECRANGKTTRGVLGPNFGQFNPIYGNGEPHLKVRQMLAGLEMNYRPTEGLTLTSATGFYDYDSNWRDLFNTTYTPALMLVSTPNFATKEFSQELRLASDFEGPLNFLIGGYYQNTRSKAASVTSFNANNPIFLNNYFYLQKGRAWSVFGQVLWDIVPTIELAAGGRYSDERKRLPKVLTASAASPLIRLPVQTADDSGHWTDFSPEVTLSWRPNSDLTVFGSYKEGFLSGGFNAGAGGFTGNLTYDQERTRGFEGGVKAEIDRRLMMSFALFSYRIRGLQVLTFSQESGGVVSQVTNAGKASIKGAELDVTYRAPVEGLTLHGALAYLKGRYKEFLAPCYGGQTQAQGCNDGIPRMVANPAIPGTLKPIYSAQDLAGTAIARAPKWTGNLGFDYQRPIGSGLKIGVGGNVSYSDDYITDPSANPGGNMDSYALIDGSLRVGADDDRWEVALIGKNLTNKFTWARNATQVFTGTGAGDVTSTPADLAAQINRGREVWLRATLRFGR